MDVEVKVSYDLAVVMQRLAKMNQAVTHYQIFVELWQNDYKELVEEAKHKSGYQ